MIDLAHFSGAPMWRLRALVVGVLALALTAVGLRTSTAQTAHAYLVAFVFWSSLSLGALLWLQTFHAASAQWVTVVRRPLEVLALGAPLFALLFIPIVLLLSHLYVWAAPGPDVDPHTRDLVVHLRPWLNPAAFILRAAIVFLVWGLVARQLFRWSSAQDASADTRLLVLQRRLGAGMLPPMAMLTTVAAFDWLMSLDPTWSSTMFGVYFFAGAYVAALAALILVVVLLQPTALGPLVTAVHLHNLGKLLLAFVCFWAYIAFSQYLLVWIANLPDEVSWYAMRAQGGWKPTGAALALGHFILPFFVLLSRDLKRRPQSLALVALWILLMHALDVYWLVMPRLHPLRPAPHWTDITAFLGVGGLSIAFFLWRLTGRRAAPAQDPYFEASLHYERS